MIVYLILFTTSVLAGITVVQLARRWDASDRKAFLAGALLNLGALVAILYAEERRRR
jgi:hypothetical protein